MATLPQELIDALEALVEDKFDELIKAHKIDPSQIDGDVKTFQEEQMLPYDGHEPIEQGFFRKFLDWLALHLGSVVNTIQTVTFDAIRYITPVDYDPAPECGKIIAPFANLVVDGADIEPTIPYNPDATPDTSGFNQASDLMLGGMAYNKHDNKWYFRGKKQKEYLKYNWYSTQKNIAFSDLFLPSIEELREIYDQLFDFGVGSWGEGIFWTSNNGESGSEFQKSLTAYIINFYNGKTESETTKDNVCGFIPVRTFTSSVVYNLRDIGPASGWIFRVTDNLNGTYTYYEALPATITKGVWSNVFTVVSTNRGIGQGQANTNLILAQGGFTTGAAKVANDMITHVSVAPYSYRVPTQGDWLTLKNYLGDNPGGKLKEEGYTHWIGPNDGATNESQFTALPTGVRKGSIGDDFIDLGYNAMYWSSSGDAYKGVCVDLSYAYSYMNIWPANDPGTPGYKSYGMALRCVRASTNLVNGQSGSVTDVDGNTYKTICIGTQEWMAEDLRVRRYADGITIPEVENITSWQSLITAGFSTYIDPSLYEDHIYDLREALHLGILDIEDLQTALDALVPKEEGKGLSENNLTDALKTVIDNASSHLNVENIHLPPDGISIQQSENDALEVIPDWIRDLFSADLPLALDANGKITLAIDETTLDIIDGKLTVIAGPEGGAKLSFASETGVLSVDPEGDSSVDLSSLAAGEGVDMSNYVKKTGELTQTIEGDLLVTGEVEPYA